MLGQTLSTACHDYLYLVAGEAFTETDQRYLQADSGGNRDDGCTAVTAVIVGNTVVVAHVGDSRAVLAKTGKGECASPSDCSQYLAHIDSLLTPTAGFQPGWCPFGVCP